MQSKVDTMGKVELRAACRDAKVKGYSKMSVATMRTALTALAPIAVMETVFKEVKREERNGVKRPLNPESKCGQVWAALDEIVAKGETDLTTAIHAIGEKRGWNRSNTSQELSAYRKHMGLSANKNVQAA